MKMAVRTTNIELKFLLFQKKFMKSSNHHYQQQDSCLYLQDSLMHFQKQTVDLLVARRGR
ncbi:hypothetical protein C0J52_19579 [Blattella germanica]|nr:hypothetical protein C0J52_19579 [Blattella germanica]